MIQHTSSLTRMSMFKVEYHANPEYENPLKNSEK